MGCLGQATQSMLRLAVRHLCQTRAGAKDCLQPAGCRGEHVCQSSLHSRLPKQGREDVVKGNSLNKSLPSPVAAVCCQQIVQVPGSERATQGSTHAHVMHLTVDKVLSGMGQGLHYSACGCPKEWIAGTRPSDVVDLLVEQTFSNYQSHNLVGRRKLNVVYMLPHHNVTGGMKCLVEHIRLLRGRGHCLVAVHRSDSATTAMPPWSEVQADKDIVCGLHQRLGDVYPLADIDVVVVGIFHQVAELLVGVAAPVLYWEQGHEWLFGDPVRFQVQHNYQKQDQLFHMVMHLPTALAAVSPAVQDILGSEFGRHPVLLPNSVDCERFFPGPVTLQAPSAILVAPAVQGKGHTRPALRSVLLVGNPSLPLKGFDVAINALAAINQVLPLHITWVCQNQPNATLVPTITGSGLCISLYINPSQEDLPGLYRGHDVFLFTSRYEAWGMPVLEAMASGLAVVATNCLGVNSFAQHSVNALLADPQDVAGIIKCLLVAMTDDKLRAQLQCNARQTALQYAPSVIAERLEGILYSLTACAPELLKLRQPVANDLHATCAWASHACVRQSPKSRGSTASTQIRQQT